MVSFRVTPEVGTRVSLGLTRPGTEVRPWFARRPPRAPTQGAQDRKGGHEGRVCLWNLEAPSHAGAKERVCRRPKRTSLATRDSDENRRRDSSVIHRDEGRGLFDGARRSPGSWVPRRTKVTGVRRSPRGQVGSWTEGLCKRRCSNLGEKRASEGVGTSPGPFGRLTPRHLATDVLPVAADGRPGETLRKRNELSAAPLTKGKV